MSLKSFFTKTFQHLFGQPPVAAQPIAAKARTPKRIKGNSYWIKNQMKDYDGQGSFIISVPKGMTMKQAHSSVCTHMALRFGNGNYKTRRYPSARTIHVRPLTA